MVRSANVECVFSYNRSVPSLYCSSNQFEATGYPAGDAPKMSTSERGEHSGSNELRKSAPPLQLKPVHVEIRARDTYQHHVAAEAGDLISWSFFTRRKNIAFGLFYVLTRGARSDSPTSSPAKLQRLRTSRSSDIMRASSEVEGLRETILASRSNVYINPPSSPKPGHGSTSVQSSRANSVQLAAGLKGSGDGLDRSKTLDSHTTLASDLASLKLVNNSLPDLRLTSGPSAPSISAPNAVEYLEILPVERYESFESTITGHYEVPVAGTFILYFDNSYSINTSKELFLTVNVGPIIPAATEVLSGWLLKKKQRRLQGWARRWFQLDRKGILSYFEDRFSPRRGSIDLHHCTITKIPRKLMMAIDSGQETYHMRAYSVEDYSKWSEQFTTIRSQSMFLDNPSDTTPVGSILQHTEKIHQKLQKSEGLIADLRDLAAREDSGTQRYLAPLEQTFQSLQELYDSLADYAIFLQRMGRRMSQVSATRGLTEALSPLDPSALSADEFFDAEEIILSEVSDDFDDDLMFISREAVSGAPSEFSDAFASDDHLKPDLALPTTLLSPVTPPSVVASTTTFRTRMPCQASPCNVSLSSILRRSIGKDWSAISMPVALNEPLSALQRMCEELEYSELLDAAADCQSPMERFTLVAAFAVSAYASSVHRAARKPFTPLLGETFEYERPDKGYRFVAEKVSHRPLIVACHAESSRWSFWQDQRMKSKFWGKSMEYIPIGSVHVFFPDTGDHFIWSKVITCIRNLLSGNEWVENYGDMMMRNERTGDTAKIIFKSNGSSFFSSNVTISNEVLATILPSRCGSEAHLEPIILRGRWDSML